MACKRMFLGLCANITSCRQPMPGCCCLGNGNSDRSRMPSLCQCQALCPLPLTYSASEHMPYAERAQRACTNIYPRVLSPIRASELAGLCEQGVLLAWTSRLYRSPVGIAYSRANLVPTTGLGYSQSDSFVFLALSQFGGLSWQIAWDSWLS